MITKENFEKYRGIALPGTVKTLKLGVATAKVAEDEKLEVDPLDLQDQVCNYGRGPGRGGVGRSRSCCGVMWCGGGVYWGWGGCGVWLCLGEVWCGVVCV